VCVFVAALQECLLPPRFALVGQVAVAKFFSRHLDLVRCRSPRRSPYRIGGLPRFPGVHGPHLAKSVRPCVPLRFPAVEGFLVVLPSIHTVVALSTMVG
jgi:hypothetical protein